MNTRIMYLRDANKFPCGCLAITQDRRNHKLSYQYSVLNPHDEFDRKMARHLALGRLVESPITISTPRDTTISNHDISELVMLHVSRSDAPKRAVRAAKLWLSDNVIPF